MFTDYPGVSEMLTHPSFTIVPSFDESHVLFAASPVSGFFGLAQRMVNQFPHEQCLVNPRFFMNTVRLSAQPRHGGRVTDQNQQAQSLPSWFPLMFDMKTEVNHFLAEYARCSNKGKENFWLLFSGGEEIELSKHGSSIISVGLGSGGLLFHIQNTFLDVKWIPTPARSWITCAWWEDLPNLTFKFFQIK